ncbi:hypothetical protein GGR54DRAFT_418606 [Hypoxylon sp. NC1633]|nr:hypothetical protein GGR54DRAFT_418606 [Hypoxylon sp. NC1633]
MSTRSLRVFLNSLAVLLIAYSLSGTDESEAVDTQPRALHRSLHLQLGHVIIFISRKVVETVDLVELFLYSISDPRILRFSNMADRESETQQTENTRRC